MKKTMIATRIPESLKKELAAEAKRSNQTLQKVFEAAIYGYLKLSEEKKKLLSFDYFKETLK